MHIRINFFSPTKLEPEHRFGLSDKTIETLGLIDANGVIVVDEDALEKAMTCEEVITSINILNGHVVGYIILEDAYLELPDLADDVPDILAEPVEVVEGTIMYLRDGVVTLDLPDHPEAYLKDKTLETLMEFDTNSSGIQLVITSLDFIESHSDVLLSTMFPQSDESIAEIYENWDKLHPPALT